MTVAVVLAWIGSAMLLAAGLLLFAVRKVDPDRYAFSPEEAAAAQASTTASAIWAMLWAVVVTATAIGVFRQVRWARWVLIALGVLVVSGLLRALAGGAVFALLPLMWVATSTGLLFTRACREWFAAPSARRWHRPRPSRLGHPGPG